MNVNSPSFARPQVQTTRQTPHIRQRLPRTTSQFCTPHAKSQVTMQNLRPVPATTYVAPRRGRELQYSINPERQHHFARRDQKQPSKTSDFQRCSHDKLQLSTALSAGDFTSTLLVEVYKHKTHKLSPAANQLLYPYVQIDIVHKRSLTHLHSSLSTRRGRAASRRLSLGRLHRPGPSTFTLSPSEERKPIHKAPKHKSFSLAPSPYSLVPPVTTCRSNHFAR